ncbi:MAG TPA: 16S rRNA (cytidine(1402)-2'-O)-methyltransferase [Bacteroidota bacterium]|nr:16S rRNA (cytidine(1402)-2'-O)-methyltransferase [Bacteroidota bacterium]
MSETIEPGALYIVSTPIGNLDDITLRAIRILGSVDLVAAEDTRKTKFLLDHLSITKPLISFYTYNEARRVPELIEMLKAGKSVALVTDAGTPGVSDPAYSIVYAAVARDVRVIPIPGASAVLAALVASGLPTDRFVFEGFLPVKKGRKTKLESLRGEERTMVFYESPFRVERTLADVRQNLGDRQVAVVRELTKKFEQVLRGKVSDVLGRIKGKSLKGEFVLVVAGASYVDREPVRIVPESVEHD